MLSIKWMYQSVTPKAHFLWPAKILKLSCDNMNFNE